MDIPKNDAGKRTRRFCATREEALRITWEYKERIRRLGTEWSMRFDRLTSYQKAELVHVHEEAERMGYTLPQLLDQVMRRQRPGPSVSLGEVIEAFLGKKSGRGMRPRSYQKLFNLLNNFAAQMIRERPIRDITTADVREYIYRNGWAAATRKSYLGDVCTFFR